MEHISEKKKALIVSTDTLTTSNLKDKLMTRFSNRGHLFTYSIYTRHTCIYILLLSIVNDRKEIYVLSYYIE